jgi:hypothetical protein
MEAKLDGRDPYFKYIDRSDVSEMRRLWVKALQYIKLDDSFATASDLAIHWGLMVNANKIFWMLLKVISSTEFLDNIQKEIKLFAQVTIDSDMPTLKLDVDGLVKSCLFFKATFFETMRLYSTLLGPLIRKCYKKVLQESLFQKGQKMPQYLGSQIRKHITSL